jgi:N-acetyl-gamma-glutamyl-phosphate reductase
MGEVGESFKAYKANGHRHLPEIKQGLSLAAQTETNLTFVPHLLPMVRGIHATLYATLKDTQADIQTLFENRYKDAPFVDVLPQGSHPETRHVRGTNVCQIALHRQQNNNTVIILSVIDNLVKGASGQAVQNMNIMFSLPETLGLEIVALSP